MKKILFLLVLTVSSLANAQTFYGKTFAETSASAITDTTSTQIVAAGATGVRHFISAVIISNSDTDTGTDVQILDGTTPLITCPAAHSYGGCVVEFNPPIRCSAATAINCKPITTGAAIKCTVVGYDETY